MSEAQRQAHGWLDYVPTGWPQNITVHRADGSPAAVCTPEEALEWAELVRDDPHLHAGALRLLAEVEDVWAE